MFKEVHPVLPCRDVTSAIEFYVQKLGFSLSFQDASDPKHAGVRRDSVELHVQWHDKKEWMLIERSMLKFVVADVNALYDGLPSKMVFLDKTTVRDTPWGTREFAF
jgi:catechol 2,3-dioxygenase-like lactoylglutathione lyase family enzyme